MRPLVSPTLHAGLLGLLLGTRIFSAEIDLTALPSEVHIYQTVAGRELKLWVAKPADWQITDHRPAIVFFHGGGWTAGDASQFAPHSRHLAELGMVAITVQYRFWDKSQRDLPEICVQDARSAFRWITTRAAELGIDPTRLAASGGSAGGHLAACIPLENNFNDPAGTKLPPVLPAALILFNPVVDFTILPGANEKNRHARERLSPLFHLTAAHPPTLIMVGANDTTTPPAQDHAYVAQLTKLGVRAEVKLYPGQVHGFFNYKATGNPWYDATLADLDQFLATLGWIKLPPPS